MSGASNAISARQNEDSALSKLAAQRQLYARAKRLFVLHFILSVPVAVVWSLLSIHFAEAKPYAIACSVLVMLADQFWLTPRQKQLRDSAAFVQETFDCELFGLPWPLLKAGAQPTPEEVLKGAIAHRLWLDDSALVDWYPPCVSLIPLQYGRIICQRINCWWDGAQRKAYAGWMAAGLAIMALLVVAAGLAAHLTVEELAMSVLAPLAPMLQFGLRQHRENADAATRLDKLRDHSLALIEGALATPGARELENESRILQDEILDHRRRTTPVLDFVYWSLRPRQEVQMARCAQELVERIQRGLTAAKPAPLPLTPWTPAARPGRDGSDTRDA